MPSDWVMKQHDTWPPLQATLSDQNGPIDLTTASAVKILLKVGSTLVSGTCTIVGSPAAGVVSYQWIAGDTAAINIYRGEFEITWSSGAITTVPNNDYFSVEIVGDLG